MTASLNRRQLIQLGTFGLGALTASASAAATISKAKGFTHGVASGEPSQSSVLLWTRYVAEQDVELSVEVSDKPDFHYTHGPGDSIGAMAKVSRDHIAKVVIPGLTPGTWYYYRFIAPDGSKSATGRTRTLPQGKTAKFNIGVVGCSNLPFGYFNAYAHAAQRDDLDLMVHTGDYLYEYAEGIYPTKQQALEGRNINPLHEMVQLTDYRLRYAAYRSDADLQRLHQVLPMIAMWDDHEYANDAHKTGAENHNPDNEGDWEVRKRVAEQVYREWMPVSDRAAGEPRWGAYQIGDLATLFLTESRIGARDEPADLAAALKGQGDIAAALRTFRDDVWQDPTRHMLGVMQEKWLASAMRKSKADGTKWQIWAQQCVMGELKLPQEAVNWLSEDAPAFAKSRVAVGAMAAKIGLPINLDAWDGYPKARQRALTGALEADADLIVLSGDSHNGWAFDLDVEGEPAGVEFGGHSVTSPGLESYFSGASPDQLARVLETTNQQLGWTDTSNRGYMTIKLTPDFASSTWHFLDSIRQKSTKLKGTETIAVGHGEKQLSIG